MAVYLKLTKGSLDNWSCFTHVINKWSVAQLGKQLALLR